MEYKNKRRRTINPKISSLEELYPHDMQFYKTPPTGDLTLSEFEEYALERLKVLRIIESINIRSDLKTIEDRKNALITELKKDNLNNFAKLIRGPGCASPTEQELQTRKRDHISHFILRLAYCRSEDLKRWFIGTEVNLFKMRFSSLNAEGIKKFLQLNNLNYVPISGEEKDEIKDNLVESTYGNNYTLIETTDYYKVPFQEVADLIRNRKVFVKAGFAYIPATEFVSVFVTLFRMNMVESLAYTLRALPSFDDDDRVNSILKCLHTTYTGKSFTICKNAAVPIENLDGLSKTSYPLCMRLLHESLRAEHHMKHHGRLQYGLFLKGIGVTLEDSLKFWREEFIKKMEIEKFEKRYSYGVRHNYGQEGKRTNYTPYSCIKIIQGNVGAGDNHGCPFRHMDNNVLKLKMLGYGAPSADVQEIGDLAKSGHYQLACTKYFESVHKKSPGNSIIHPNGYFEDSQKILHNVESENKGPIESTKPTKTNTDTFGDDEMDAAMSQLTEPMDL